MITQSTGLMRSYPMTWLQLNKTNLTTLLTRLPNLQLYTTSQTTLYKTSLKLMYLKSHTSLTPRTWIKNNQGEAEESARKDMTAWMLTTSELSLFRKSF